MVDAFGIYRSAVKADEAMMDMHFANYAKSEVKGAIKIRGTLVEADPITLITVNGPVRLTSTIQVGSLRACIDQYAESKVNDSLSHMGYYNSLSNSASSTLKITQKGDSSLIMDGIDKFFNACRSVGSDPGNMDARRNLIFAGKNISMQMNGAAQAYIEHTEFLNTEFNEAITEVNRLAVRLGEINNELGGYEYKNSAELLVEQRNILRELSEYGNLKVIPLSNDAIGINIGNFNLVDYGGAYSLPSTYDATAQTITDGINTYDIEFGSIAGILNGMNLNNNAQNRLNTLSDNFRDQVNTFHAAGNNLLGNTNVKFFDDTLNGAANLQVNAVVLADPKAIAAGTTIDSNDSRNIRAIIALRTEKIAALGNQTFTQYYSNSFADIVIAKVDSEQKLEINFKIFQSNERQAAQTSKISKEEEGMEMFKYVSHIQAMTQFYGAIIERDKQLMQLVGRR